MSNNASHHDAAAHRARGGGRPLAVYIVLAVGVVSLLVLLLVVYFSADRSVPRQPICSAVSVADARQAVLEGRVDRVTIAYDDTITEPTTMNWGPVLGQVWFSDGQCGILPEGVRNQQGIYDMLGVIRVYNDITERSQVDVNYDRTTQLQPQLFASPTPPPTPTTSPVTPSRSPLDDLGPILGPPLPGTPTP